MTTHYADDEFRKFRWRLHMVIEAEPRVLWAAFTVALVTAALAWNTAAPVWQVLLAGRAWWVFGAFPTAAVFAFGTGWLTLTTVSRLDSPDTPFPTFHIQRLIAEARAPKAIEDVAVTVALTDHTAPAEATVVALDHDPTLTRSPHVCCPHEDPTVDPFVSVAHRIQGRVRRWSGRRDR